jgi:hypothetical protein
MIGGYPDPQDGGSQCKICRYRGHNQATCPCLRDALEKVHEEQD